MTISSLFFSRLFLFSQLQKPAIFALRRLTSTKKNNIGEFQRNYSHFSASFSSLIENFLSSHTSHPLNLAASCDSRSWGGGMEGVLSILRREGEGGGGKGVLPNLLLLLFICASWRSGKGPLSGYSWVATHCSTRWNERKGGACHFKLFFNTVKFTLHTLFIFRMSCKVGILVYKLAEVFSDRWFVGFNSHRNEKFSIFIQSKLIPLTENTLNES